MAIKLTEAQRQDAVRAWNCISGLTAEEENVYKRAYNDVQMNLREAARSAEFTWRKPIPLVVLLRIWLSMRAQGYQASISFDPQSIKVESYT